MTTYNFDDDSVVVIIGSGAGGGTLANELCQKGVPVVVMAHTLDQASRESLHEAGAAAVFFRQAELDAYRREAASIVSFWARNQRLDAVGM